jgi:hypothetical protein
MLRCFWKHKLRDPKGKDERKMNRSISERSLEMAKRQNFVWYIGE